MATTNNSTPRDLTEAVRSELKKRSSVPPSFEVLIKLFECLYFASIKTEESQAITIQIVYLNPDNPDPKPPKVIVKDRWSYVRLAKPVRMTLSNLVKIAKASDPRSSSFGVYPDENGRLLLWGLIDQGNRYYDFVNYESESGPERPGLFQASIAGIGHVVAYVGYEKIAELRTNILVRNALDVLRGGPVLEKLKPGIQAYHKRVHTLLPRHLQKGFSDWAAGLTDDWISSVCRLLLRVQNYRHGGALLITPDDSFSGLKVQYRIKYDRLQTALENQALFRIKEAHASDQIFANYVERDADEIPIELYFDESINKGDLEDSRSELEGAIWFISLLTRVDGLVLMTPSLGVRGFGVEITTPKEPSRILMARDRRAKKKHLRKIGYERFGTRHRSMMRYCNKIPESVGFVISQDGYVRVMTQVRGQLVMWENIRFQLLDFVRHRKRRKKIIST